MNVVEVKAMALYQARTNHAAAKAALRAYREECGDCADPLYTGEGPCYARHRHPFYPRAEFEKWCAVCQGSQPLWEAYRDTGRRAGLALRYLMAACRAAA